MGMNGTTILPMTVASKNPALPTDLAEWHGAVRLTHFALEAVQSVALPAAHFKASPEDRMFSFAGLLTTLVYSLARGIYGSEELEQRAVSQPDLRYLCANNFPDAVTLRQLRRRHWMLVRETLAKVLALGAGVAVSDTWFDPQSEADQRLERAAAADSLALDW
jgi:hypothetical protein